MPCAPAGRIVFVRTLYLVNLGGAQYGIWKDEVCSVTEVETVHRIPLSPACIAGVSVIEGRSTALADLAVCIGLQPVNSARSGRVLLVEGRNLNSGFIVFGTIEEVDIPPDAIRPMHSYVRSDEIDICAIHGSRPVPVIGLGRLYDRLHGRTTDPPVPALALPAVKRTRPALKKPVRLFSVGGEIFALSSTVLPGPPARPGGFTPVALAPRYVKGLVVHEDAVIPVISLARRMGLPGRGMEDLMVVANFSRTRFGLLVDEEKGKLPAGEFIMKQLPPVTATGWTQTVVLSGGMVIPLVEPARVLATEDREESLKLLPGRYSPDPRFLAAFGSQGIEVVEFSLLGVRHAVPKSEVEDILPFKPYRRLPDTLPIVIGVAEHEDEILPVLDLALVFGRRSRETSAWNMILVRNGDFRALVITEAVYEAKMIPRDLQRKVPIVLPHHLVYGCYPEGAAVCLILNVEALAVHFDKSIVKRLLPALTQEMAEAPAELVPSLLPEEHVRDEELAAEEARREAEEQEKAEAEASARKEAAGRARSKVKAGAKKGAEKRPRREAGERSPREKAERERREAEARAKKEREEKARRAVEDRDKATAATIGAAEEPQEKEEDTALARTRTYSGRVPSVLTPGALSGTDTSFRRNWKKYGIAAAVGLVLISLVYFGAQREDGMKKGGETAGVEMEEGRKAGTPDVRAEAPQQQALGPGRKRLVREEPVVLTVPADRPVEFSLYVVKKGDTLWAICKRFTGDPFNYPRVARDNSIANPDLIFPDQKIFLSR